MKVFKEIKQNIKYALPDILKLRNSAQKKEDGSYVTGGDLYADTVIANTIRLHYPNAIIVSEESKQEELELDALGSNDIFVVDPIDGTENFTSGLPEWGISVSHYSSGKHTASMLWCPEMGLWLDSRRPRGPLPVTSSRIAGISSSMRLEDLQRTTPGYEYRMFGCCVYSMIQTVKGCFLSFENPRRAHSWDILAGLNIALINGLSVKVNGFDYTGDYLPHSVKYSFRIDNTNVPRKN
jgi:fructose-1,6-bisphosphatase/inositol monophosphatase family enzyme